MIYKIWQFYCLLPPILLTFLPSYVECCQMPSGNQSRLNLNSCYTSCSSHMLPSLIDLVVVVSGSGGIGSDSNSNMSSSSCSYIIIIIIISLLLLLLFLSLVTGLFFLVPFLNQWWSPLLGLQVSDCSTFRTMCDVPSIAVFCTESIESFPGMASKFFLKPTVTIPVAPIITGIIVHDLIIIVVVVVVVTDLNRTSQHLSARKPSPIPDCLWD